MSDPARPRLRTRARRGLEIAAALLLATVLVAIGVVHRTDDTGLVRVADDQVAVVVDRWTGARRIVTRPGRLFFVPLLEKVYAFDRSPRTLRMEGSRSVAHDVAAHVRDVAPKLIARARDGSSFWLETVEIQYALLPGRSAAVLDDAGPGAEVAAELLAGAARSILRDEFGRFNSEEVAQGACATSVANRATSRLNDLLAPHGVEVLGISLGKAGFDEEYEESIRRRAAFAQEVERLDADLVRLESERVQKEEGARREKEVEARKLEGLLVHDLGVARADDVRVRQEADDCYRAERETGAATKHEKEARASLLRARYTAAARTVYRETVDLERTGDLAVREALVRKLGGIQFELAPYDRDGSPRSKP